jgi:YD repeat-containing protein
VNGRAYTSTYTASTGTFTHTTPAGRQSLRRIDAHGRTLQTQVTGLHAVARTYDARGRLATITQGSGAESRTTTFSYNAAGFVSSVTDALGRRIGFAYDGAGRMLSQTLADGRAISFAYDAYGNATHTYTANGELQSRTDPSGTTTYTYDPLGNLLHVGRPNGTQIDYLVDGSNRRIGKKVNGALAQGFLYDGQLRIVAELDAANAVVSRFVYGSTATVPAYMTKGGASVIRFRVSSKGRDVTFVFDGQSASIETVYLPGGPDISTLPRRCATMPRRWNDAERRAK